MSRLSARDVRVTEQIEYDREPGHGLLEREQADEAADLAEGQALAQGRTV